MLGRLNSYLRIIGVFLILAALLAGMAGCNGGGNNPPPSQNLEIRTWYDLNATRNNLAGHHTLMNDLDSTTPGYEELASPTANQGEGWAPIAGSCFFQFTGSLDGQGYQIRDLFINRPDTCWVGLFGFIGEGGRIENVGMVNADVTGSLDVVYHGCDSAGSLAGANVGTVNNSYSTGSVICKWHVGGLVGDNYGTVSNSYYSGNVTGNVSVGGLVGKNGYKGTVSNSYYNYDEVLINGENIITIGALFGEDFGEWLANDKFLDVNQRLSQENGYYLINDVSDFKQLLVFGQNDTLKFRLTNNLDLGDESNFYIPYLAGEFDGNRHEISNLSLSFDFVHNVGLVGYLAPLGKVTEVGVENVDVTGGDSVGGLVGGGYGTVSNSYSTGNVTGYAGVGGLVGDNWYAAVSNSYSSGRVSGAEYVGGLVGHNSGTVSNCYSTDTTAGTWGVGGLVGENSDGVVSDSYSSGNVTGNNWVGGLVGYNPPEGTVSNSFWDIQASGQTTSDGGTGKNTTEMHDIITFSGAAWNITAVANSSTREPAYIWNIVNNVTYPFLSWQA